MLKKYTLIDELEVDEIDTFIASHSLSEIFKSRRYELQDYNKSGRRNFFPWKEIEKLVGLSKEILQKKIRLQRTMTRDCLIAICAAHGMDAFLTSKILNKNGMHSLDEYIPRDNVIIGTLVDRPEEEIGTPVSAETINKALLENDFAELEIKERAAKCAQKGPRFLPFRIEREYTQTYRDDGDPYDSLATAYDFRFECRAVAMLDCGDDKYVRLTMHPDGHCMIENNHSDSNKAFQSIDSEAAAGVYAPYYARLKANARKRQRELDALLNDTRNYKERIGARLKNDRIHVFYEEYNYGNPEMNEYFLMEYVDGYYQLSIAHHSMFMRHYLSDEEYRKHFGTPYDKVVACYSSENEIINKLESCSSVDRKYGLSKRLRVYKRLYRKVSECLDLLRKNKVFVQNSQAIWDNPYDVLRYYQVTDAFCCTYDDESGEICSACNSASFPDMNGDMVAVSVDDLTRAFQLGFKDIAQICRVLTTKGSIEAVLE